MSAGQKLSLRAKDTVETRQASIMSAGIRRKGGKPEINSRHHKQNRNLFKS